MNAFTLNTRLQAGEITAQDLTAQALLRAVEDQHHCLISINQPRALAQAAQADLRLQQGQKSALIGLPVVAEDSLLVKDWNSSGGSRMLANFAPPFSAEVINRLEQAGLILIAKTNLGELHMGGAESSFFGAVTHPLDHSRLCGGAAAAVAAGITPFALAVDSGGEIRREAAQAGVTCIKPTYGTVSRFGIIANISSCEQVAVVAKTIREGAALLSHIAGHDPKDGTSRPQTHYTYPIGQSIQGQKIAVIENYLGADTGTEQIDAVNRAAAQLQQAGAIVEKIHLHYADYAHLALHIMAAAEGCNNISRFDGVKYGYRAAAYKNIEELYCNSRSQAFGAEVKERAILGVYYLAKEQYQGYYLKALQLRGLLADEISRLFHNYQLALTPVAAAGPYAAGEDAMGRLSFRDSFYTGIP
ncbi:MAG: amidase family protein, partial [Clostridiales bacterium]